MACVRIHVYLLISDENDQQTEGLINITSVVFPGIAGVRRSGSRNKEGTSSIFVLQMN